MSKVRKGGVSNVQLTGPQIRAARTYLDWTIMDLARAANVGISTVQAIERNPIIEGGGPASTLDHRRAIREEAVTKIRSALESAGITFRVGGIDLK